jgi:GntP family gluconate:H+ symporter
MVILYLILSIVLIVLLTVKWKVHPFLALLLTAILYGFAAGVPVKELIAAVNTGFGETLGKIGIIIVLGCVIGAFLENSGGAYALAEKVLSVIGRKKVPTAMGIMGYIVSIPVFADSGFLLLSPLNKSLSKRAGITLAAPAIALALGLIATHTMAPPTPGPIAAAGILDADLGLVLAVGLPVAALAMIPAIFFAKRVAGKVWIDPNPNLDAEQLSQRLAAAPTAYKAALPIVVPIVLIVVKSVFGKQLPDGSTAFQVLNFIGEPFVALLIGTVLALFLPKKFDREMLSISGWTGTAMQDAASIILITGAGGVFGKMLQVSGISDVVGSAMSSANLGIWLPFLIASALKTAQGSSTVAIITTASIVAPLMGSLGLDGDLARAMTVIAIGAGSTMVCHANDSFFWVVTQMSGMDVKRGYSLLSLGSAVLGLSAAILLFLFFKITV